MVLKSKRSTGGYILSQLKGCFISVFFNVKGYSGVVFISGDNEDKSRRRQVFKCLKFVFKCLKFVHLLVEVCAGIQQSTTTGIQVFEMCPSAR